MMCATCGCSHGELRIEGQAHSHGHHSHVPGLGELRIVQIERDILSKNDSDAAANRRSLEAKRIFAVNMVSSPGSGKTSLLVRTLTDLAGERPLAVIEGDQETSNDADRIRATGAPAVQINTGRGCHLDAHMVGHALEDLKPAAGSLLFIENVGNLVCPAAFDLGEAARVVVLSVTEGEDKPIKYPDMFASADLVIFNKVDLLPYLNYDVAKAEDYLRRVNRKAQIIKLSATGGQGLDSWYHWLRSSRVREAA
jgi:hydrogenase nickel incorporation protein HypB